MVIKMRRAQALMELAFGLFALALITSALCGFAIYIAKSLKMENSLRVGQSSQSDSVKLSTFAAKHFAGTESLTIKEKVVMPQTTILR